MNKTAINPRNVYGDTLVELGEKNPNVVVLDADLSKSTKTFKFGKRFPDRFFNMGIAEANMISVAAGLASCGKIPFASTFAVFAPGRSYDQIRMSVAYSDMNVKIFVTHAGVSVGKDGVSHQMLEDIALMRVLPNMSVFAPSDPSQTKKIVKIMAENRGPMYARIGRESIYPIYDEKELEHMEIGKAINLRMGNDLTIIACGTMVNTAVNAAEQLQKDGIDTQVVDMWSIKPLDERAILDSSKKTGVVITIEEHSIIGGLGSAVAEVLAEKGFVGKFKRIGVKDVFCESGEPHDLLEKYSLNSKYLIKTAKEFVKKK
ncbi:transketolase, alpha subunit [Thermoplasmatales archaeon SCGC AB-539-N05]|nr:transketolase, alpha subunit [Thermoplasmatales archaeon SCGC AB-539-N05]